MSIISQLFQLYAVLSAVFCQLENDNAVCILLFARHGTSDGSTYKTCLLLQGLTMMPPPFKVIATERA